MDRRMGLLHRLGPGDHRVEIDELAMVFGFLLHPDFLHRLDQFAHPLEAAGVDGAVVFHFVLVPAAADAEQEAPWLTWSIEATSLAVWIASRCCTSSTPVPNLMVLVTWLAAASTTNGSIAS